jgi:MFS family permease
MVLAKLLQDDFGYRLLYLLHILFVVVGFGSTFVYAALASRARKLSPTEGHAITHASLDVGKGLTTGPIWGAGIVGVILVLVGEGWEFSQAWISIAFVLFIIGVVISTFVHTPNLKAMDAVQERLIAGDASPSASGAAPPEVAELQQRGKRAGMTGGILHLIFLLLVIDMIWKPGFP